MEPDEARRDLVKGTVATATTMFGGLPMIPGPD